MTTTAVERPDPSSGEPDQQHRGRQAERRRRLSRAVHRFSPRRLIFTAIMAVFVALILASYAVPLWFQLQGDRLLVVTSGSMEPEIAVGSAVVVRPFTSPSQLRVGQVVTFWPTDETQMVTHRIIALTTVMRRTNDAAHEPVMNASGEPIMDPYIQTQGDSNQSADANLTPYTQVRGVVREVHTGWGYLLAWAHSGYGRFTLFVPPLLLLLGAELLSRVPERWSRANWNKTVLAIRSREAASRGPLSRDEIARVGAPRD